MLKSVGDSDSCDREEAGVDTMSGGRPGNVSGKPSINRRGRCMSRCCRLSAMDLSRSSKS